MKGSALADWGVKVLSCLKFNYLKEDDSELGRVDFGVLTVAMMVAALDGVIQPAELAAFAKLSRQCRISDGERAARYESALHSAGYIMLMSRSGLSEKSLVETFAREAERVLPMGFAGARQEDMRRALVIWITMGMSDGNFCGIERKCVDAFCVRVAEIMRKRRDCRRERLWIGLCPGSLAVDARKVRLLQEEVTADEVNLPEAAEKVVAAGDLAAIRRFIVNG